MSNPYKRKALTLATSFVIAGVGLSSTAVVSAEKLFIKPVKVVKFIKVKKFKIPRIPGCDPRVCNPAPIKIPPIKLPPIKRPPIINPAPPVLHKPKAPKWIFKK